MLYCATICSTLLGLLASIVNTRFLQPSDYGDVRYVQNIIYFLGSILLFGYFWSGSRLLALSKNEQKSRQIRGAMILILIFCFILMEIAVFVCFLIHLNTPYLANLFLLSMLVCAYPLISSYIETTAQGDNHIGKLSAARILPYAFYIPIAYLLYSSTGATSSKMILLQWGIYSTVFVLIVILTRPSFKNIKSNFNKLNIENKKYGLQLYFGSLAMIATNYLAGISLGAFNDDNINVGFYTLSLTITTPLSLLPGIIGTTYFKEFATLDKIPTKVFKATVVITGLSCLLFILLIQPVVTFFYSETYSKVGIYSCVMSVGFSVHGIGDMINRYLGSHGQGISIRNSSFICGAFRIVGFSLLVYLWDINGALLTNILSSFAYCLVLIYYYRKYVNTGRTS